MLACEGDVDAGAQCSTVCEEMLFLQKGNEKNAMTRYHNVRNQIYLRVFDMMKSLKVYLCFGQMLEATLRL